MADTPTKNTRTVKRIKVDLDKCIGCCACEVACSGFHAEPKYSSFNPARSRIRMVVDELNDMYVPVRSTNYSRYECAGRNVYAVNGKNYSECSFCGTICPARDYFRDPDSGLPLKCDMCEDDPPVDVPKCVKVCTVDALTYEEFEETIPEAEKPDRALRDMVQLGLESLVDEHGIQKVMEVFARVAKKGGKAKS